MIYIYIHIYSDAFYESYLFKIYLKLDYKYVSKSIETFFVVFNNYLYSAVDKGNCRCTYAIRINFNTNVKEGHKMSMEKRLSDKKLRENLVK